ncbi:MAG: ATP-binding protein [Candidatus Levybacteria bacterium]|nr:ATP-binding protein [Candidatus Levybacteria bacterium]
MNLFGSKKKDETVAPATQQPAAAAPVATPIPPAAAVLDDGTVSLADILSPSSVEVDFKYIRVGEKFMRTLFVVGYPRYVAANWLEPLINFDHQLDISMFVYPTAANDVLSDLRRKIAEMEATIASEMEGGRVVDPKTTAALEDALGLQEELAKGVERFFLFSLYITISSDSLKDLDEATKKLTGTMASILLLAKTATLQMEEGFKTTLPIGRDMLYITRNMDTTSLASTFPFTSAMLTQEKGVLYGINQQNGSLIIFDRFSLENANEVVLGKSGAGKSYLIKIEVIRQLMFGTEVIIVDPEGEYEMLAETLGGEALQFSSSSPVKINPFDLAGVYEEGENELGLKILSLFGLLKIITGDLDPAHDAILDRALVETYRQKGITTDPATQQMTPPLMEDLYKTLLGTEDPNARELALRLEKFIKGSLAGIFNQQSNFNINKQFTVFSLKGMEEELRPIAMHIILDFVWTKVRKDLKKRVLILDEAWYMMKYQDSASFVYGIAKRARKYYLGMTTATQDVEDFISTDYGKAVLTNSSIQMLLKQGTAEVDLISKTFFLSEGERELLISADVGEGLFFAGHNHVAMKVIAAAFEHEIATSNPIELSKRAEDKRTQDLANAEFLPPAEPVSDPRLSGITPPAPTEIPHPLTPAGEANGGQAVTSALETTPQVPPSPIPVTPPPLVSTPLPGVTPPEKPIAPVPTGQ